MASAAHLREAVELSAEAETRAQLALECGRALYFALDDRGAREVFTRGIELLGSRRGDLRELLEAELMHVSWFVPELYCGAPERLTRIDPESLAGGEGSDLLLAVLAYNEARLGRDRARCVALAERALRGSTLEEGASFGLYYALLAMGFAGELETATAIWNRALSAARARRPAHHAQHADLARLLRAAPRRAPRRRIGRARGPGAR